MGGKKKGSKPMFPDVEWWKDPPASEGAAGGDADPADANGAANYGSTQSRDEEGGGPSFPLADPFDDDELVYRRLDHSYELNVPSDVSDQTSSSSGSGSGSGSYDSEYDEEIEPPHRTLGLICFDVLRFVSIGANFRSISTQIFPVFLAWGQMELLQVALR